jgi:hypothetical protein
MIATHFKLPLMTATRRQCIFRSTAAQTSISKTLTAGILWHSAVIGLDLIGDNGVGLEVSEMVTYSPSYPKHLMGDRSVCHFVN